MIFVWWGSDGHHGGGYDGMVLLVVVVPGCGDDFSMPLVIIISNDINNDNNIDFGNDMPYN